jgi:hypothetical protein
MAINPISIANVPAKIKKPFMVVSCAPRIGLIPETIGYPEGKHSGQCPGSWPEDLPEQAVCHTHVVWIEFVSARDFLALDALGLSLPVVMGSICPRSRGTGLVPVQR